MQIIKKLSTIVNNNKDSLKNCTNISHTYYRLYINRFADLTISTGSLNLSQFISFLIYRTFKCYRQYNSRIA